MGRLIACQVAGHRPAPPLAENTLPYLLNIVLSQIDHAHLLVLRVPSTAHAGVLEPGIQQILPMPPAWDTIIDEKTHHHGSAAPRLISADPTSAKLKYTVKKRRIETSPSFCYRCKSDLLITGVQR